MTPEQEAEQAAIDQATARADALIALTYANQPAGRRLTGRLWHQQRRAALLASGLAAWGAKLRKAGRR